MKFHETYCFNHCLNCFEINCQSTECEVIDCSLKCGYRMHACKIQEHKEQLCLLSIIGCVNKEFGCPHLMQRRFMNRHIQFCPASIVHCTVEWNRMPRFDNK